MLSELYNKISKILGPSPFSSAGHSMMGPLGLLSPHPGVSYLFSGAEAAAGDGENSLWGIAHGSLLGGGAGGGGVQDRARADERSVRILLCRRRVLRAQRSDTRA